jgi:hypothetical protein
MKIKRLNEQYFGQSFSGDGYNTSNGVFRVHYKPYDDLSISRGRDPIPSQYMKGQEYQIGDKVRAKVVRSDEFITGNIVTMNRNSDSSEFLFTVKSDKTNKIYPVVTASIKTVRDTGYIPSITGVIDRTGQKMAMNMKYGGGRLIWGRLESEETKDDILLTNNGKTVTRKGVLDNSLTIASVGHDDPDAATHHAYFKKLGIAYLEPKTRTIYIDTTNPDFSRLTPDHMITIEAHELAHTMIQDRVKKELIEVLADLVAARILRNKGYHSPYKIIVSNFIGRHKTSYGEELDANQELLDEILQP